MSFVLAITVVSFLSLMEMTTAPSPGGLRRHANVTRVLGTRTVTGAFQAKAVNLKRAVSNLR